MILSIPGKALRMLVDIARLGERLNKVLKAEPGKLGVKRHEFVFYLSVYKLKVSSN